MKEAKTPILDSILEGIGDAITDIRQKVVEEPLYGRAVTETAAETNYVAHTNNVKTTHIDNTRNYNPTNIIGTGNIYADTYGLPKSFEEYRATKDASERDQGEQRGKNKGKEIGD